MPKINIAVLLTKRTDVCIMKIKRYTEYSKMEVKTQSQDFSSERVIKFHILRKKYTYPKHLHQFAEIVIPIEGALDVYVDSRCETIDVGQAALILPFQTHEFKSNTVNKLAIFAFSPSVIPDFFSVISGRIGERTVFVPKPETLELFQERIFSNTNDIDLFNTKGAMYLILNDYICDVPLRQSSDMNDISATVVKYINAHIREEIALADIADLLGYNPNYLSSKIQELFNMNLPTLIASIRSDKAKNLLFETNKTGLEICYECGFGSERSFHRQFKAITGSTPKEYRKNLVNRNNFDSGFIKYF